MSSIINLEKIRNHEYFWPVILTLTAFLLRIIYLLEIKDIAFLDQLSLDPGFYDRWGMRIASGELMSKRAFFAAPLYAYILGFVYAVIGHNLFFVRILQAILGSINLLMIFSIAKHYFNKRIGYLAAIIYLFYGVFYFYESLILKTSIGVFLNLVLVYYLVRFERDAQLKFLVGAGISLGFAAATRGNILLFIPFLFFYLYLQNRENWLKHSAVVAVGISLVLSPFTMHNYLVSKDFVLINSNGGVNFYIGNNPKATGAFMTPPGIRANMEHEEVDYIKVTKQLTGKALSPSELSRHWFGMGLRYLGNNISKMPKLYLKKVLLFWNHLELADNQDFYFYRTLSFVLRFLPPGFGIVAPLGLAGMLIFHRQLRELSLLYLFIIISFISVMPFFVFARYRLGMLPLLIIFAAALIDKIYENLTSKQFKQLPAVVSFIIIAGILAYWPLAGMKSEHTVALSYKKYGESFYREKKYDQAIKYLKTALQYFPAYPEVYNRLGIIYLERSEIERAAEYFKTSVDNDPTFLEALSNYAQVMERIDPSKATELWQRYLQKAENNPQEIKFIPFAKERLQRLNNK